ncbi:MAG TPA: LCP family protein [Ktedonobacteraceae bacterium]|nr:LCP family protein [Ktedonobacteraceae bacterium]
MNDQSRFNVPPPLVQASGSGTPATVQPPSLKKKRKRRGSTGRVALILFLLIGIALSSSLAYGYFYNNIAKPLAKFVHPVSRATDEPVLVDTPSYNTIMGRSWNILLLGSDNDGKYTFPAVLTQVMMVIHIDTVQSTVDLVSIPRDSWVWVPATQSMHKIDQAFFLGATQNNSFDEGVRAARQTVEQDYGITIDRYAWVGLSGFAKVIDTLGGVDIDVTHPVTDDAYPNDTGGNANPNDPYAYKRLYIAPGPQHLDGVQALEYVRSRHADLIGDIGRTQRQQQVLEALKLKLNLANVLDNLQQLLKDMEGQVYTDLSEPEMIAFANFGRTLSNSSIQRITLGPGQGDQNYGNLATLYDPWAGANQDVVIPHCNTIQPIINRVFDLGDAQSCNVTGDSP